jgi:hypothetical protein
MIFIYMTEILIIINLTLLFSLFLTTIYHVINYRNKRELLKIVMQQMDDDLKKYRDLKYDNADDHVDNE